MVGGEGHAGRRGPRSRRWGRGIRTLRGEMAGVVKAVRRVNQRMNREGVKKAGGRREGRGEVDGRWLRERRAIPLRCGADGREGNQASVAKAGKLYQKSRSEVEGNKRVRVGGGLKGRRLRMERIARQRAGEGVDRYAVKFERKNGESCKHV